MKSHQPTWPTRELKLACQTDASSRWLLSSEVVLTNGTKNCVKQLAHK